MTDPVPVQKRLNRTTVFTTIGTVAGFVVGSVWPIIRDELHWSDELTHREQ